MPDLDPRRFDQTKPLQIAEFTTVNGHDLTIGTPLTIIDHDSEIAGDVSADVAIRLWMTGKAIYAADVRPTPAETPEQERERLTVVESLGGGWYSVRSPGVDSQRVQGAEAAEAARADILAGKPPAPIEQQPPLVEPLPETAAVDASPADGDAEG